MPNTHGFQLLGRVVACIDCDARGFVWDWPEKAQAKHQQQHVREREETNERQARQRARDARRLAAQAQRENEAAYGRRA
jgi:hypothetical protein